MITEQELEAAQDRCDRLQKELEGQYIELACERAVHTATENAFRVLVDGVTKK